MEMTQRQKTENLVYAIVWGIGFLAAVAAVLLRGGNFRNILQIWGGILPFLLLFLLHNYLVSPLLAKHRKTALYIACTAILVGFFALWTFTRPHPMDRPEHFRRPDRMEQPAPMGQPFRKEPPSAPHQGKPEDRGRMPMDPNTLKFVLGILLLAANLGMKAFFRGQENEERMKELEKENLRQQLEYLRYQINPHFFMNTLNNIHALVDIDPSQAKSSIVELSKLMRYLLYEGDKPTIPLDKETEFLTHYISLMRLRYADSVRIDMELPGETGGIEVPPLVYASFIENAFKHGISYEEPSFIRISLQEDKGKLIFKCANSRHPARPDDRNGIGQENVRRRLDLLYGSNYTLHYDVQPDVYDALLILPVQPQTSLTPTQA